MKALTRKLKKFWDEMTDEEQEALQAYVNEMEMRGFGVIVLDPDGENVEVI